MTAELKANHLPISKIFSSDYVFVIPPYQRPYAWTTEESSELLDDLMIALGTGNGSVDALNPYFLGSIVLVKNPDSPEADILDGQQRLTTLTILLSALRQHLPMEHASQVTQLIYDKANPLMGSPDRFRLTLKNRDNDFFERFIQRDQGIAQLDGANVAKLSDAQVCLRNNALLLLERVSKLGDETRIRLTQYIVKRCFLVVVSTSDNESAFRIFSVMNNRGMPLTTSDILKAEIIGCIPGHEQAYYTKLWDEIEDQLGRDALDRLFAHIRMIVRKTKQKDSILKDFQVFVKPSRDPKGFLEKTLVPLAEAYEVVLEKRYAGDSEDQINESLTWLGEVDNIDWQPVALVYLTKHRGSDESIARFLCDLERLASVLMINRSDVNQRIERYASLLSAIESNADVFAESSPLQLQVVEQRAAISHLDGDVYEEKKTRLFILKRLDALLAGPGARYEHHKMTIEHVLPQNPSEDSQWMEWWPDENHRRNFLHRLGNLVLLDRTKNASARNYEFEKKKQSYFARKGVSPFMLTTTVLSEADWTPEVVRRRQTKLLAHLCEAYRLKTDVPKSISLGSTIFDFRGKSESWFGANSSFIDLWNDGGPTNIDGWQGKSVLIAVDDQTRDDILAGLRKIPFFSRVVDVGLYPATIKVDHVVYFFDFEKGGWLDESKSHSIYLLDGMEAADYSSWDGSRVLLQAHDNQAAKTALRSIDRLKDSLQIEFPAMVMIGEKELVYDFDLHRWESADESASISLFRGKRPLQSWLPKWDRFLVGGVEGESLDLDRYPFFRLAEDVVNEDGGEVGEDDDENDGGKRVTPLNSHELFRQKIAEHLKVHLVREQKSLFRSIDGEVWVSCTISRVYEDGENRSGYWFAVHPRQLAKLDAAKKSFVGFGCGSEKSILLVPLPEFRKWTTQLNVTELENGKIYWHVKISEEGKKFKLRFKGGIDSEDLTRFLLPA